MSNEVARVRELINDEKFTKGVLGILGNDERKLNIFKSSLLTIASEPSLAQCSAKSILESAKNIAELDLSLNRLQGHAYILRYGAKDEKGQPKAQAIIGYKGYVELAKRAGLEIKARSVFSCDEFDIDASGFSEKLTFKPNFTQRNETDSQWFADNFMGVIVMSRDITTGSENFDFVGAMKLYKIAGLSPSKNSKYSPHQQWQEEMAWAKAIKYVVSKMPLGEKIARAVAIDNLVDTPIAQKAIESMSQKHIVDSIILNEPTPEIEDTQTPELPQQDVVVDESTGEVFIKE